MPERLFQSGVKATSSNMKLWMNTTITANGNRKAEMVWEDKGWGISVSSY